MILCIYISQHCERRKYFYCKTNYCVFECNKYLKVLDNTPDDGNLFAKTYIGVVDISYTC
jgi:hypothetical protein